MFIMIPLSIVSFIILFLFVGTLYTQQKTLNSRGYVYLMFWTIGDLFIFLVSTLYIFGVR